MKVHTDNDQNYMFTNGKNNHNLNNIDNLLDHSSSSGSYNEGNEEQPGTFVGTPNRGEKGLDVRIYRKKVPEKNAESKGHKHCRLSRFTMKIEQNCNCKCFVKIGHKRCNKIVTNFTIFPKKFSRMFIYNDSSN